MTSTFKLPVLNAVGDPKPVRFYQRVPNSRDSRLPFAHLSAATLLPLEHGLIALAPSPDTSGSIISDLGGWKIVELTSRLCHISMGSSLDPTSKDHQTATHIRVKLALDSGSPSLVSVGFTYLVGQYESLDGGVRFKSDDSLHITLDLEGLRINHSPSDLDPTRVFCAIMDNRLSVKDLRSSLGLSPISDTF